STVKLTLSKISSTPDESTTRWLNCLTSMEWVILMWIRRSFTIVVLYCFQLSGSLAWAGTQDASPKPAILVIGDSLSAEYGLQRGSGWVSLIEKRLQSGKTAYQIHNSSISGDTTSGG